MPVSLQSDAGFLLPKTLILYPLRFRVKIFSKYIANCLHGINTGCIFVSSNSAAMKRRGKIQDTMARIFNNSNYTLSPSAQQAIQNACANAGIGDVTCKHTNENTDDAPIFDVYDEETETYHFSIETDGDVIFER